MQTLTIKNIKLVADEGKLIQSKSTHFDEEMGKQIPDVLSEVVYLGKNDSPDNYIEVEKTEEGE